MKPIPPFIYKKKNQITMVLVVPLFAMLFILIYKPLNFDQIGNRFLGWLNLPDDIKDYLVTCCVALIGMAVAAVSRLIMTAYTKKHAISYLKYIGWVACEIVILTLIYTIVSAVAASETQQLTVAGIFRDTLIKTILILLIPYSIIYVCIVGHERARELKTIRRRLEEDDNALQKAYVQLFDEKGKMHLSVRRENLLVIESADNYVCVWYLNGESIKKVMIRTTLKQVSEQLAATNVLRCHRSYMINLDRVKVLRREKEGIFVEFGIEGVPDIPISKTYSESITHWLTTE
ncbi:LytTR family transcriptional regulator DNA-binding domain-containing protein [uncultured Alistipes sp.]|uniref:LytTR family transcriptional regulator DNA-binding domain-containing protein n=1 Tax=uncultured Alistipes sp. TaxID=538949 RepID=UPI00263A687A|nr:LytTR family transcriptional regulator DNA-binding domain-containing protein [uncultured Alistipes sp.]